MAVRTTDTEVKAILLGQYDLSGEPALTAFIATASSLTDYVDTCDTLNELSTATLELIERWLAAHYYAHADQLAQSKSTGDASSSFQGVTGKGLESTQYGQTAINLDITGCLAKKNREMVEGKVKAGITWLGKAKSDQTEYVDRD